MKFDPSPTAIWRKYERDRDYKRSIGLYDRVRRNEAFYLGRQWEGLRVQSLDPLIFNVLRRCVNLFVSMLVSDDVACAPSRSIWTTKAAKPPVCWSARSRRPSNARA